MNWSIQSNYDFEVLNATMITDSRAVYCSPTGISRRDTCHKVPVYIQPSGTWQNKQAQFWHITVEMVHKEYKKISISGKVD